MENYPQKREGKIRREYRETLIFSILIFLTYLSSFYNYLLFHTLAELFSIIIGGGIFLIGWNSRKYSRSSYFLALGISFIFIAFIDLIHTLAYKGMDIFVEYEANLSTQLWIAARYLQAGSFLFASLIIKKHVKATNTLTLYTIITAFLLFLIFSGVFPVCYIEGIGLTPYKIISEYVINLILVITIFVMYKHREDFDKRVFTLIIASIVSTIIAELAFTFYIGVYDLSNLIGHLFKILASFLVYLAIIKIGLENPYNLLFRDLAMAKSETDQIFNSGIPLMVINKDCEIIRVNDTYCSLLQVKRETLIGKKCFDAANRSYCFSELCSMNRLSKDLKNYEYELEQKLADGKNITFIVHSVPYLNDKGEMIGIIQNFTDITTRKQAEELLLAEKKFTDTTLNAQRDTFFVFEPSTSKAIRWNKAFSEVSGYTDEEISSMKAPESYYSIEDLKLAVEAIKIIEEEGRASIEMNLIAKDGQLIPFEYIGTSINDKKGNLKYIVAVGRDITERKKAEQILNQSKVITDNLNEALILFDINGTVSFVNPAYKKLTGYRSSELIGLNGGEIAEKTVIEHEVESVKKVFGKALQGEELPAKASILRNKDGREIPIEFNVSYVRDEKDQIVGIVAFISDITERKKAEQRLKQFISVASHELRTPTSVLLQSINNLNKYSDQLSDEQKEQILQAISRNAKLLAELTEYLLILSGLDEKRLKIELRQYNPREIVQNILDLMESIRKSKNVSIELEMDENVNLFGDSMRISQIFRILIDNALKFSKKDSKIKIIATDGYNGQFNPDKKEGVLIQFVDQGIGIREEELDRIFSRFYRSEDAKEIPGTGLGLSIANELVEIHEGKIFVESVYGKGSTFSVFLPRLKASQSE